jgi:hypothetical protein
MAARDGMRLWGKDTQRAFTNQNLRVLNISNSFHFDCAAAISYNGNILFHV